MEPDNACDHNIPTTMSHVKKKSTPVDNTLVKTSDTNEVEKDIDAHPWALGHFLVVKYRDGSDRLAVIIERSKSVQPESNGDSSSWRYYIHYQDFNRRMDEWIHTSRVVKLPSEAYIGEEKRKANVGISDTKLTTEHDEKYSKRKKNAHGDDEDGPTTVNELEHNEHEGMDEASLKEHEEITKVKNVQNVVLGKHIMECWYFSPYPKELFLNGPLEYLYYCE